jgi:hypothetical protein
MKSLKLLFSTFGAVTMIYKQLGTIWFSKKED